MLALAINIVFYCTDIISIIYYALPGGELLRAILFFLLMGVIDAIIELPISYIFNFKIEAEFGFNKTTPKTFVVDIIKNFILGTVLNWAIFGIVCAAYAIFGDYFGIIAFLGLAVFMILASTFSTVFSKLFNKFTRTCII